MYDRLIDHPGRDDKRVLEFIRTALTPEAIAERPEHDQDVKHLREVAAQRLRPYETKEGITHAE